MNKPTYENRILELLKHSFDEINEYLDDDDVIEIMLNPDQKLWIDTLTRGAIDTGITVDKHKARRIINIIATVIEKEIDDEHPIISAELPESGSRFEATICGENPVFCIRKKAILIFTLDDYIKQGNLTEKQKDIIVKNVKDKKNILVIGGTSTGKTTFANAILNEISKLDERLIILEDTRELQSSAKNTVSLKSTKYAGLRDLLKCTMRLNPDRIIVGEIRDASAIDLLTAWNSGHPGGVSTIHSYSALGGLKQLEQYIQRVSPTPQKELISMVVDLMIVLKQEGRKRKVDSITIMKDFKDNQYILEEI